MLRFIPVKYVINSGTQPRCQTKLVQAAGTHAIDCPNHSIITYMFHRQVPLIIAYRLQLY